MGAYREALEKGVSVYELFRRMNRGNLRANAESLKPKVIKFSIKIAREIVEAHIPYNLLTPIEFAEAWLSDGVEGIEGCLYTLTTEGCRHTRVAEIATIPAQIVSDPAWWSWADRAGHQVWLAVRSGLTMQRIQKIFLEVFEET